MLLEAMHETKGSVRSVQSNQAPHGFVIPAALLPSSAITHFRTTSLQFHAERLAISKQVYRRRYESRRLLKPKTQQENKKYGQNDMAGVSHLQF